MQNHANFMSYYLSSLFKIIRQVETEQSASVNQLMYISPLKLKRIKTQIIVFYLCVLNSFTNLCYYYFLFVLPLLFTLILV